MNILRKTLMGGSATLIPALLFVVGFLWSAYQVVGTPGPLKQALHDSNIYAAFPAEIAKSASDKTTLITAADPQVNTLIKQSFTPAYFEQQTNGIIDGVYDWAQGKTPVPNITIDYTTQANTLLADIHTYAAQRLDSLPQCATLAEAAEQATRSLTQINCLPADFDKTAALQNLQTQLTGQGAMLEKTKLTGSEIKTASGQPIEQALSAVPTLYQQARTLFIVTICMTIVLGVVIVFTAVPRQRGFMTLGISLFFSGFVGLVSALGLGIATNALSKTAAEDASSGQQIAASVVNVVQSLGADIKSYWLWFNILLMIGSGVLIITLLILKRRAKHREDIHGDVSFSNKLEPAEAGKSAKPKLPTA